VAAIHKHRDTGQELLIDVMDVMATIKLSLRPKTTTHCNPLHVLYKVRMTRHFIPGIDDDYKFTRSEYAQFLGISPNALRMKMRRGTHNFDYVIKDGKYLFKRPRENMVSRPPNDHLNPSSQSKRKRGAHKEGKANYPNDAFEMHNEMKILNNINKKFKSEEHKRRFEQLNDAALEKIDKDIKAEQQRKIRNEASRQQLSTNREALPWVNHGGTTLPTKYGSTLNAEGLKRYEDKMFEKIDRQKAAAERTPTIMKFDYNGDLYDTKVPDFSSQRSYAERRYKGYDITDQDDSIEVPGVYTNVTYRNQFESIPRHLSKVEQEIWKLKNKKL
jgi:hypothetical protein